MILTVMTMMQPTVLHLNQPLYREYQCSLQAPTTLLYLKISTPEKTLHPLSPLTQISLQELNITDVHPSTLSTNPGRNKL